MVSDYNLVIMKEIDFKLVYSNRIVKILARYLLDLLCPIWIASNGFSILNDVQCKAIDSGHVLWECFISVYKI